MSLILDALKKVEQETAAHKGGMGRVEDQIFQDDRPMPKRNRIVLWTIASGFAGAVIAVALVAGYLSLTNLSGPGPTAPPEASQAISHTIPQTPRPQQTADMRPPQDIRTGTGAGDVRSAADIAERRYPQKRSTSPPEPGTEAENKTSAAGKVSSMSSSPDIRNAGIRNGRSAADMPQEKELRQRVSSSPRPDTAVQAKASEPKMSSEGSFPALVVSGIIWTSERVARRAVVNDLVREEGAVIAGAKIVEISPNSVRFSRGSESFELSIGQTR
jgi:hypothetical protein